jgi:hypothetical protein
LIENLPIFHLGETQFARIEITRPGNFAGGILDYGIVYFTNGAIFTGFLAAVSTNNNMIPDIVLDEGSLTQPDGKTFVG